ncbi:DUF4402 domain-containing protein [Parasphingorhabdus sp.]|uniref:DUF4402 domain-containing protein n=1 Tax=Parasphingorhabdus sp. TaxID=2709688 RepID=UPI00359430FE
MKQPKGFGLSFAALLPLGVSILVPLETAQAASGSGQTQTNINRGVTIIKNADLHFGDFIAGTTQSRFSLNADNGAILPLNGNAVSLGGTRTAASFTAFGAPLETVRITVSQNQIDLTRVNGSEKMRVDQFRFDGGNGTRNRMLDASGSVTYRLGGRLTINPNQVSGAYVGSFNISIDYQ